MKVINLMLVVFMIFAYNKVVEAREQEERIDKLQYELDQLKVETEADEETGLYTDGEYEGEAKGYGGNIRLKVKVESGYITSLDIISAEKEDSAYLDEASNVIEDIIESQSTDVDAVSGATFTSVGIMDAVDDALY